MNCEHFFYPPIFSCGNLAFLLFYLTFPKTALTTLFALFTDERGMSRMLFWLFSLNSLVN